MNSNRSIDTGSNIFDPVWRELRDEAEAAARAEPALGAFFHSTVLDHARVEDSVVYRLSQRLDHPDVSAAVIAGAFQDMLARNPNLGRVFRADLAAVFDRDPACRRYIEPLLYFKGFHALVTYRFGHELWLAGRQDFALYLQSQSSRIFGVDIHPAAEVGIGLMLDHGTGIVVGETARIGDNCSILHEVTLGGTGNVKGDRHPKLGSNVMIGAGAKVLGNIQIGDCCRIAAGSVVLKDVPDRSTVAGVPGKVIGPAGCPEPARTMDQLLRVDEN